MHDKFIKTTIQSYDIDKRNTISRMQVYASTSSERWIHVWACALQLGMSQLAA